MILLVFSFNIDVSVSDIDYEDIYDNINDYECHYNRINNSINWDMNKQLVQKIVEAANNRSKVYYIVETKYNSYNCYGNINLGDKNIAFIDDYNKTIVLGYENVVGVKVRVI